MSDDIKMILKETDEMIWTASTCFMIEKKRWTFVKTLMNIQVPLNSGNSGLAEEMLACQKGLCCMG
jgi:hypothetical protein